jgi:hypothetical protein
VCVWRALAGGEEGGGDAKSVFEGCMSVPAQYMADVAPCAIVVDPGEIRVIGRSQP